MPSILLLDYVKLQDVPAVCIMGFEFQWKIAFPKIIYKDNLSVGSFVGSWNIYSCLPCSHVHSISNFKIIAYLGIR